MSVETGNESLTSPDGWEDVLTACEVLDDLVGDAFGLPETARARAERELAENGEDHGDDLVCGCWSAHEHATDILQLLGRHVDAALILIRSHPGYAPAVQTLARTVIEHALRIGWLLGPSQVEEREARAFALQAEEWRLSNSLGQLSDEDLKHRMNAMNEFLAEKGASLPRIPTVEGMSEEVCEHPHRVQSNYRLLSQPVHGTLSGAKQFSNEMRIVVSDEGGSGEWQDAELVALPMLSMWGVVATAITAYRDLLAPDAGLPSLDRRNELIEVLRRVPENVASQRVTLERNRAAQAEIDAYAGRAVGNRRERRAAAKRARKGHR